jgi:hypothetical protein
VWETKFHTHAKQQVKLYMSYMEVKVKLSLCFFNWAPRHEDVLGSGGIVRRILWPER